MARSKIRQVAVIGGGASGLTAAKCLLEQGLTPIIFEQSAHIGGVWSFDEAVADGGGPAYKSLHTNTPKQSTAYSDFPFRDDLPEFPACSDVMDYLSAYVDRFGLRQHIRFNAIVEKLTPESGGRWTVHTTTAAGEQAETFDAALVCSGMFHEPLMPVIPGLAVLLLSLIANLGGDAIRTLLAGRR